MAKCVPREPCCDSCLAMTIRWSRSRLRWASAAVSASGLLSAAGGGSRDPRDSGAGAGRISPKLG